MPGPALTVDQNILPVQAYFNLDGTFNTFIGQGQPFVISATESIGIVNTNVNATLYPTFTSATSGQVTGLAIASPSLTWNPGTGVFSAPTFFGTLNGTANTANNLSGGGAGQIVYQNALGSTAYLSAGSSGQFLLSNGTSAPSWSTVATSVTISDQTTDTATYYPLFYSATSGSTNTVQTSSTKLQYVPSTGTFKATIFSGSGASLTNIPNSALSNSSVTIGSTSIALGATSTTLAGLTSVTATSFIGALNGNANTATTATNATNSAITDNTSSIATWYPTLVSTTSGNQPLNTSSTKLSFVPSTGVLSANGVALTGNLGTVTSVSATVPSFLSITGSPITTSGTLAITYSGTALPVLNGGTGVTTSTGSGNNVLSDSPVLVTPNLGTPSAIVLTNASGTASININGTVGATTATTGKFTTLEATGTSSLGTASTTYVQIIGDASYPVVKATGGTNTPLVLSPLGTGALQAQKTDSTSAGGNVRGANAVDWQTNRSTAAQVASGGQSVISGGVFNTAIGGVSVVVGGSSNSASGYSSSILGGTLNTSGASGTLISYGVVCGGQSNSALGSYNFIGGGFTNSGTSGTAVTTQSATMNGTTAVTLAATNASIKVGQYITGTSIANETYVAAISGTSLTLSKVASGSSTSTLSFYTPHGVVVGGGNNQATGSYSFIGGGGDAGTATNRNAASGDWSTVVGGTANRATALGSFVGGGGINTVSAASGNTASGVGSVIVGGFGNNHSGNIGFIGGGSFNNAGADSSTISGGRYATDRNIIGNFVFAACKQPIAAGNGYSQGALLVLGRQTTDATATVLTSDANAATTTNQIILPDNSAYFFKGEVISGVTGGGNTKGWSIEGVIKRGSGVGTTALVGSPTITSLYADVGASTWSIALAADTTNGGLKVTFTGQAATTIRTVCQIRTTEMTY